MRKKIFRSMFITTVLTVIASLGFLLAAFDQYLINLEEDRLSVQTQLAASGVSAAGMEYLNALDVDDYRITWIGQDGTVLFDNKADPTEMENHLDREEIQTAISNGQGMSERTSSTLAQKTIYYAIQMEDGSFIRTSVTRDTVGLILIRMITPLLWIMVVAITACAFLSQRLSKNILKPFNEMDLDHPLQKNSYEELKPLLTRIDQQNKQIQSQVQQLHQKQKEFDAITQNLTEGLILINAEGDIVAYNPAASHLLDCAGDLKGLPLFGICRYPELQKALEKNRELKADQVMIEIKDKKIRFNVTPISSRKVYTGSSILLEDISESYAAEMQRREFTANVSHELKTPLQTIMGSSELLENHLVKKEDEEKFLHKIGTESKRLLTLIDDIIRLSQLDETGGVSKEPVSLDTIVKETVESLEDTAQKHEVTLTLETVEEVTVCGDARLFSEIVYNLTDNAIRYNRPNGYVKVSLVKHDHQAVLLVADNGIGIPVDSQTRIFERFYRVDKSHSRATGGTGLGLSIVKHAVQLNHGTIHLESRLNEGSTFKVILPLSE